MDGQQVGRLTVPEGWGKNLHAPIIGELFHEMAGAEVLKEGTVYAIVVEAGDIKLVEVGPSALESGEGGRHYGWQIDDMLTKTDGAYVMTKQEFAERPKSLECTW